MIRRVLRRLLSWVVTRHPDECPPTLRSLRAELFPVPCHTCVWRELCSHASDECPPHCCGDYVQGDPS
jgi:hypothetical protein